MATVTTILQDIEAAEDAGVRARFALKGTMRYGKVEALIVGLDNGNDALKAAMLTTDGTLATIRVPAAYREAEPIRGGVQELSYQIGALTFWVGEAALTHEGEALPVAPTRQRLVDPRQRQLMAATLVELLYQAGYPPGDYAVVLGFAVPNTEITVQIDAHGQEKLAVDEQTRSVLEHHLKGATWTVGRTDPTGMESDWIIRILTVLPQAQTGGTVLVTTKAANGKTVTDHDGMVVIDLGGGDIHETEVTFRPAYQMITRRLGDGSIRIARALKRKFPRLALNDAMAQHALQTSRLMVSGKTRDISPQVQEVLDGPGQAIIADILPSLRQARRFVTITGGLTILLHDRLQDRLAMEDKQSPEDYIIINHTIASVINAIGVLFGVIFRAAKKD